MGSGTSPLPERVGPSLNRCESRGSIVIMTIVAPVIKRNKRSRDADIRDEVTPQRASHKSVTTSTVI